MRAGLRDAFVARRTTRALKEAKRDRTKPKTAAQRAAEIAALADMTSSAGDAPPTREAKPPKEDLDAAERMHRRYEGKARPPPFPNPCSLALSHHQLA